MGLADEIRQLEHDAPRLYSRWSPNAWRLACEGPALRLWGSLAEVEGGERALSDYLFLLREAIGLQYLSASAPNDLNPRNPHGAGARFLGVAWCETLPRLLASAPPSQRAQAMAQLWNAGERLIGKPAWLDRYLATRLLELPSLEELPAFLARALEEGLDDAPAASWRGPLTWSAVDLSAFDRAFLPGRMHLATPAIACVHDRRRDDRQVAILLRRKARGGAICLGATPCLGEHEEAPSAPAAAPVIERELFSNRSLPEPLAKLATRSGFALLSSPLSQRLWIGETRD